MARLDLLRTLIRLGPRSLIDVGWYRLLLKAGLHPVQRLRPAAQADGPFFRPSEAHARGLPVTAYWRDGHWAFGYPLDGGGDGAPPDWHADILSGIRHPDAARRWDRISAFSSDVGDIKTIWEASRFDWMLSFAQAAANGDDGALRRLEDWLRSWREANPAFIGPNWMCAQEASIRLVHMLLAGWILGQLDERSSPSLLAFVRDHLLRIAPTTAYARGQNNNHATSEAMALFAGGSWLERQGDAAGRAYARKGRRLLEERVAHLVFEDGGFAQYSTVYHRLMLDALSVAELFRRRFGARPFSRRFHERAAAAARWLRAMIVGSEGDVPNWGANDGAMLLPIGSAAYRDFRPSAALAMTLFEGSTPFVEAPSVSSLLVWLDVTPGPAPEPLPADHVFEDSGLLIQRRGETFAMLRLPGYRFRPGQCDGLHLELWYRGAPMLCDAGSYSYADPEGVYFSSTAAHNVVQFDGGEQMPRLSRFLLGSWLKRRTWTIRDAGMSGNLTDYQGHRHHRSVCWLVDGSIEVKDRLDTGGSPVRILWHVKGENLAITMEQESIPIEMQPRGGKDSIFYLQQQTHSVVTAMLPGTGVVRTLLIPMGRSG